MKPALARDRLRQVLERWFLIEPLLFSLWSDHRVMVEPVATIRVGGGVIGYNPDFIESLTPAELEAVMRCEAVRILLKHPYSRRLLPPRIAWQASNLTLREHLGALPLPLPTAFEVFGHHDYDRQFYEFYHHRLLEEAPESAGLGGEAGGDGELAGGDSSTGDDDGGSGNGGSGSTPTPETAAANDDAEPCPEPSPDSRDRPPPNLLDDYAHSPKVGLENTRDWDADEFFSARIDDWVSDAELNRRWGTLPGDIRLKVLANRRPRLDYRSVLRLFRRSVLSERRRLTRMKPSRRYDFLYFGSRYEFATRLLVAVDISGSMRDADIALGFSVINRFFNYGIDRIDVIAFDTAVRGEALTLKRARREFQVQGRGGTDFNAVIEYLDAHPGYDGAIVFTDGIAPPPRPPRDRRTRLLWLFLDERTWRDGGEALRPLGWTLFLRAEGTRPSRGLRSV